MRKLSIGINDSNDNIIYTFILPYIISTQYDCYHYKILFSTKEYEDIYLVSQ